MLRLTYRPAIIFMKMLLPFCINLLLHTVAVAVKPPINDTTYISGNIKGLQDSVIWLSFPSVDTSRSFRISVKDGVFAWKGVVTEPANVFLFTSTRYLDFFVAQNSRIKISGALESIGNAMIEGSAPQDEYKRWRHFVRDMSDSIVTVRKKRYIAEHPSSIVSTYFVWRLASIGDFAEVDSLYRILTPLMKATTTGQMIEKRLAVLKKSAIGQPMIDFMQQDTSGKQISLSSFRGKYVLLDFWASWCYPCRAETPNVLKVYEKYKDHNFTVIGISLDEKAAEWKKAIQEDGMPWTQVSDLKGFKNEIALAYGINAIPLTFLINPDGIIIAKNLREEALPDCLSKLLDK